MSGFSGKQPNELKFDAAERAAVKSQLDDRSNETCSHLVVRSISPFSPFNYPYIKHPLGGTQESAIKGGFLIIMIAQWFGSHAADIGETTRRHETTFSNKWPPQTRAEGGQVEPVGGFDIHLLCKIPADWLLGTFA